MVLHDIEWNCPVFHAIVWHYIVLHRIAWYHIFLICIAVHCIVFLGLHCIMVLHNNTGYCIVLHCIVLYDSQGCVIFFFIKYCFPNLHWIHAKAVGVEYCEFVPVNYHLISLPVVVFAHCGGGGGPQISSTCQWICI